MSAPGGVVLVASAIVSSPILWLLHQGAITLEDALVRGAICLVVCRVAISVVASLAYSPPLAAQSLAEPAAPATPGSQGAPGSPGGKPLGRTD